MGQDTKQRPLWLPMGDQALLLDFTGFSPVLAPDDASEIDLTLSQKIAQLAAHITDQEIAGITELVPSLTRLMIAFDYDVITPSQLKDTITLMLDKTSAQSAYRTRRWSLPICYDGAFGPDIAEVAERISLSPEEVISRHLNGVLQVSVMGFMPGLGYMTGVDSRLTLPRRANPRTHVPQGSVGIAMGQSVIYPLSSPGGWHLIGRTPFPLFDPKRADPILLRTGDTVTFQRISEAEFTAQERAYHKSQLTAADLQIAQGDRL